MSKGVILCVDDEKIILDAIKAQLKEAFRNNYIIEIAQGGEEALEIMDEYSEDGYEVLIVISDWLMPNMKGDEFLIKAHEKFPKVFKLMLTGQADQTAIKRAQEEANLHKLINKPWDTDELISSIKSGLEV
jgi:response regulator RpfG family c-di-GMP phosphodiesterase